MSLLPQPDTRLPIYQKLRDEFARNIAGREWAPGETIPPEQELARRTNASVGTIRKAIELLVSEGLLERFQGRGTFVRRPTFDGSPFRFFRFEKDTGERAVPISRILSRTVTSPKAEVVQALKVAKGTKAIRMQRLRLFEDDPILIEEIWLPLERFKKFLDIDISSLGNLLYAEYERQCGIMVATAQETLTIEHATAEDAKRLKLDVGAPVIAIERLAFGVDREPVEFRRSHGPADKFRYHVELR